MSRFVVVYLAALCEKVTMVCLLVDNHGYPFLIFLVGH